MKIQFIIITVCFLYTAGFSQPKIKLTDEPDQKAIDIQKSGELLQQDQGDTLTRDKSVILHLTQKKKKSSFDNLYNEDALSHYNIQNVLAWVDKQFIYLSWSAVGEATGFNVYRKNKGTTSYKKLNTSLLTWPTNQKDANTEYDKLLPKNQYSNERDHILETISTLALYEDPGSEYFDLRFTYLSDAEKQAFYDLGQMYYQIALIIGYGYQDYSVSSGKSYTYKVTYLDQSKKEVTLGEVDVKAGEIKTLTKPAGLEAQAGDEEILLLWDDPPVNDYVAGYHVYRAKDKKGPFKQVSDTPVLKNIPFDINRNKLETPQYGYLDTNVVNYTTYYYKVAPRDALGKASPMSNAVHGTPKDLTPPRMVKDLSITPKDRKKLMLAWTWVTEDVRGRYEKPMGYHIFRYDDYKTATADTGKDMTYKIGFEKHPKANVVSVHDTIRYFVDKKVVAEKVYWYKVACEDTASNMGRKTAAQKGILPDYIPPDSPLKGSVWAEGFEDSIVIHWQPPDTLTKNKDLAGFKIYRGICGKMPADPDSIPYPLHLLSDIGNRSANVYADKQVPKDSPICYRYALKAYDKTQNLSVMSDSVCERLQDKTPPEQPVVTALQARNKAILIEAVAPPIQDFKGFVIERSESKDGNYTEIFIDDTARSCTCKDIPASSDDIKNNKVNLLSYLDKSVKPEKTYWYKVYGFDWNNNVSPPSPAISTYTYEVKKISKPLDLKASLKSKNIGCSIELVWKSNLMNNTQALGFAVFRSLHKDYGYRQISALVTKTQYTDVSAGPETIYWYKVQAFFKNGDRSEFSDPVTVDTY